MVELTIKLQVSEYLCEPCTMRQGTPVRELVRMIPESVIALGRLEGFEFYCCPICFEPKFDVKSRKPVKWNKGKRVSKCGETKKRSSPVLVKD